MQFQVIHKLVMIYTVIYKLYGSAEFHKLLFLFTHTQPATEDTLDIGAAHSTDDDEEDVFDVEVERPDWKEGASAP